MEIKQQTLNAHNAVCISLPHDEDRTFIIEMLRKYGDGELVEKSKLQELGSEKAVYCKDWFNENCPYVRVEKYCEVESGDWVKVVRCEDCKKHNTIACVMPDGTKYCGWGKRKEVE